MRTLTGEGMEFIPYGAKPPCDHGWQAAIDDGARRLMDKLLAIDPERLPLDEYNEGYLSRHIKAIPHSIQKDAYVLALAVSGSDVPPEDMVLVDYGGGTGTMSMLAREAGIGTVIYTDIYDVSCKDAASIARDLDSSADHYVCGEIDEVVGFLQERGLSCNVLVSMNVIEHIYDIEHFLSRIPQLGDRPPAIALYTSANGANPARVVQLMREQRKADVRGKKEEWGHKKRDCLEPFLSVRREMVREQLSGRDLPDEILDALARNTRGMRADDIRTCLERYAATGVLPDRPSHVTNTCDPYTGNWAEHLMAPRALSRTLRGSGMRVEVLPGYYSSGNRWVGLIGRPVNLLIRSLRPAIARGLAPSYVLCGKR